MVAIRPKGLMVHTVWYFVGAIKSKTPRVILADVPERFAGSRPAVGEGYVLESISPTPRQGNPAGVPRMSDFVSVSPHNPTAPYAVSLPELAKRLGVNPRRLRHQARRGDLPAPVIVGGRKMWTLASLDAVFPGLFAPQCGKAAG